MSKNDEFKDLRLEMKKLKSERKKHLEHHNQQFQDVIERIKSAMEPVINAFVETDPFLEIQSNGLHGVYIAYANVKVCGISISATSLDNIIVNVVVDSIPTCIYSGKFNEKELKNEVKNSLLNWYRNILL